MTLQLLSTWHLGTEERGRDVCGAPVTCQAIRIHEFPQSSQPLGKKEVSFILALYKWQSAIEGSSSQAPGAPCHLLSPTQTLDVGLHFCSSEDGCAHLSSHQPKATRRQMKGVGEPRTTAMPADGLASSFQPHAPRGRFHLPTCQAAPLSWASFLPPWSFFNKTFHSLEKHLP